MGLLVLKFGGSSVADVNRVQAVAQRIASFRKDGLDLVVVVSAMGRETDYLTELARKVCPDPDHRELDVLLASGEQRSASLLAIALRGLGHPARSF
jgi:aspartate kinase